MLLEKDVRQPLLMNEDTSSSDPYQLAPNISKQVESSSEGGPSEDGEEDSPFPSELELGRDRTLT